MRCRTSSIFGSTSGGSALIAAVFRIRPMTTPPIPAQEHPSVAMVGRLEAEYNSVPCKLGSARFHINVIVRAIGGRPSSENA